MAGNNAWQSNASIVISAGMVQIGNGGTSGNIGPSTVTVTDNAALVFNRSDTLTVSNVISGTGTVTQNGSGTTILAGANTYSGDTTISQGKLELGASQVIPDGAGKGNVAVNGGTLDLGGYSETINGLSGSGAVDNSGAATALTVGNNNATSTFSGAIGNTARALHPEQDRLGHADPQRG